MTGEEKRIIAEDLYNAELSRQPISKISTRFPEMNVNDSYEIQSIGIDMRIKNLNRCVVGKKIGITSIGMMKQLNCDTPDYGILLNNAIVTEGQSCSMDELISPRIEGELAFIIDKPLKGPRITIADVYNATAWVVPCFEVCDTRVANWDVTVKDTISDNAGASKFVLGSHPKKLNEINPRLIGMMVEKNGVMTGSAAGAEVMGNPVASVCWLANRLFELDTYLEPGEIILSGSFMSALPAQAGDSFMAHVDGFPSVGLRFE